MAELRITEQTQPGAIAFNYEELKAEIEAKAKTYETLVYTDVTMAEAKTDKANLNKLKKALNDERIRREREFMEPFNDFKNKVNEIIAIIDKPVAIIDKQVKEFEESEKRKKKEKIEQIWSESNHPAWMNLNQIWNEKWLNKSFAEKEIWREIESALDKVQSDLSTISSLPEFSFEALESYKLGLDLGKAIAEGQRLADLQKRKAEAEAAAAARKAELEKAKPEIKTESEQILDDLTKEEPKEPEKQWVRFKAYITTAQALLLRDFFREHEIDFMPL